ncbi:MAG: hypothetical protein A2806_03900 [Candidatus Terrybacteria bacterium RIFCSPHIGHO2_01_FULL_48_17]|uniref:DUF5667 domain-containing protein n=1 Tax=Candidatus Terrybacteria bacterium RIFCSPHIGHO2_01_FULL_48_17 TaxID=1802362 RepID=A0A1G2PMH8_9BACT|nr:MAG: hypothetical protein A2806_03900 [Candidatus Terrybacteria bacterium RIFCSPHIGHO2_01_FULL_48_17]OHA53295.1 MAG: hypothetical protein A3A30_03890 [Candidatus Terrybacteria bacterium RIFCSPLOWO2_01_FULL_48_14]
MSNRNPIFQEAQKVRLSEAEHAAMRSKLIAFIKTHPVRDMAPRRPLWQRSPFYLFNVKPQFVMPFILAFVILFAVGGGASFAAENSLPGEMLYPVKVNINEEVHAAFAFSQEAKIEWEAERAARRLNEAEQLAQRGEFDAEVFAQIEQRFAVHAERVRFRIEAMGSRGETGVAAQWSSHFEVSLQAHERILSRLAGEETSDLLVSVRENKETASSQREELEEGIAENPQVQAAAEGRLGAIENKIAEARKFLERQSGRLGEGVTADAQARLQVAEDAIAEGKTKMDAGEFAEAFRLFQKAHRIAQEAQLLAAAMVRLDLDIDLGSDQEEAEEEGEEQDDADESKEESGDENEAQDLRFETNGNAHLRFEIGR